MQRLSNEQRSQSAHFLQTRWRGAIALSVVGGIPQNLHPKAHLLIERSLLECARARRESGAVPLSPLRIRECSVRMAN